MNPDCVECGRPLRGDETQLCNGCVSEAYAAFEAYQDDDTRPHVPLNAPTLGIWEGIIPEPDLPTDDDTEPNATDWQDDCGYDMGAGFCRLAYPNGCPTCPHWQAIGDVQP